MAERMQNRYGSLASRVYHLDKPVGCSFGDIEFYADRLAGIEGTVFEPAVGTGRALVPLLERGICVIGSDPSEEMLAICREECERRGLQTELSNGAFDTIPEGRGFSAVIIPAGSIQLVTDPLQVQRILARVRSALAPGGRFIFDLDPLSSLSDPVAAARCWNDGADMLTLTAALESVDFTTQTSVSQLRYERWRGGVLQETELDRFALRFWGAHEIVLALRSAGFAQVDVVADYTDGQHVSGECRVLTVIAHAE